MNNFAEIDFTRVERGTGCLAKGVDFGLLWVRLDSQVGFTSQGNPWVLQEQTLLMCLVQIFLVWGLNGFEIVVGLEEPLLFQSSAFAAV